MEFLIPNGYLPCDALLKKQSESKTTKELNILPPLEYLNCKFDYNNQMSEEIYERLRKSFESRPPFVFYFNPSIQLKEIVCEGWILRIGFFDAGTNVSVNKLNRLLVSACLKSKLVI